MMKKAITILLIISAILLNGCAINKNTLNGTSSAANGTSSIQETHEYVEKEGHYTSQDGTKVKIVYNGLSYCVGISIEGSINLYNCLSVNEEENKISFEGEDAYGNEMRGDITWQDEEHAYLVFTHSPLEYIPIGTTYYLDETESFETKRYSETVEIVNADAQSMKTSDFEQLVTLSLLDGHFNNKIFAEYFNFVFGGLYSYRYSYIGTTETDFLLKEYDCNTFDVFMVDCNVPGSNSKKKWKAYYIVPLDNQTPMPRVFVFDEQSGNFKLMWRRQAQK